MRSRTTNLIAAYTAALAALVIGLGAWLLWWPRTDAYWLVKARKLVTTTNGDPARMDTLGGRVLEPDDAYRAFATAEVLIGGRGFLDTGVTYHLLHIRAGERIGTLAEGYDVERRVVGQVDGQWWLIEELHSD